LAVAALLSLLGEQRLIDLAAHLEHAPALPIAVLDASFGPPQSLHVALVVLGAVQTLILWGVARTLRDDALGTVARIGIALVAAVMLAIALGATTITSFDPYAYAGYAKLASLHAAYAPPPERFAGAFGTINDAWGAPMVASYYGPLWIALDRLVAGGAPSLPAALLGLRLLETGALGLLLVALVLLASWALGGAAYFHDLFFRLGQVDATAAHGITALSARAIKLALALIAVVALVAAFARGVVWRSAGWSTIALSSMVYPWYLAWSIAYAALERVALVRLLVLFPLAAALLDVAFAPLGLGQLAMFAMLVAAVVEIARRRGVAAVV
jgi:hypothetical protein